MILKESQELKRHYRTYRSAFYLFHLIGIFSVEESWILYYNDIVSEHKNQITAINSLESDQPNYPPRVSVSLPLPPTLKDRVIWQKDYIIEKNFCKGGIFYDTTGSAGNRVS